VPRFALLLSFALLILALAPPLRSEPTSFAVRFTDAQSPEPLDGRLLLLLSNDDSDEPRFQIEDDTRSQLVFGIDVEGWKQGTEAVFEGDVLGYPLDRLKDVQPGAYRVQVLLHRYETFRRADGHTVKLPAGDRGEGQQWNRAPGNLYSTPAAVTVRPEGGTVRITLDQVIPPIPDPPATRYIRHEKILSERLTKFWGRPTYLGAHVLVPHGFDEHPEARYPLMIYHGHFPDTFGHFREEPPDPNLKPDFNERFNWPGYNRTQQELSHQFYKDWISPGFPRVLIIQIQHPTPYYDDSYAVNSANMGPYGDALTYELVPHIEKKYRGLGTPWSRFLYGGSTGGWEAFAAQVFYPDEYNGAYIACPDPVDFRAMTVFDLYKDKNAYFWEGRWTRTPRPGRRNYLGQVSTTVEAMNRMELVLGTKGRSGGQWDAWQAVYSPVDKDGYPKPIWDKLTGVIDPEVAAHWRENYDLSHILQRDWKTLGPKLVGKINVYVGDMDNYYLNNAVYLLEEFLESTKDPHYGGEVKYGDRAEHCWNGDPTQPNAVSRLRYHQMYVPRPWSGS
jgi:hypothetical protein